MSDFRQLPKVDTLSRAAGLRPFSERVRNEAARRAVDTLREGIRGGRAVDLAQAEAIAAVEAAKMTEPSLRPAINLSGVILHTGLGRARLAPSVADHVAKIAHSHATVEFDDETGKRGDRQEHVRGLLRDLTGAEDALVVNNAAAGVFLTLSALCAGREVILSRGQMVEIGGSFRMPDIVRQSGCQLVEVGCTNKTHARDYVSALSENTAAILRCHPSNFRIVGFTSEVSLPDLVSLSHDHGALCIDDQGNGCLVDLSVYGLPPEPTLADSISGGADVAIASGDKLLGGPQAGMILGRPKFIDAIRRHPLARAVRVDKLTLAALEATLRLYGEGRQAEIPVHKYLGRPLAEVKRLAGKLAKGYSGQTSLEPGTTEVGGGSAPGVGVATFRVGLASEDAEALAGRLRGWRTPIVGRIERGLVWLDPRTVEEDEVRLVQQALAEVSSR